MEPALSVQIVLTLAAQEAMAAAFEEIQPAHIYIALLKFAELEEPQFQRLVTEPHMAKTLIPDRDTLRERLAGGGITVPDKSKLTRHKLREEMGKGGHPFDPKKVIHRSSESKALCQEAENVAIAASDSHWRVVHLLDALVAIDFPDMVERFATPRAKKETPLLHKYGTNLCKLAEEGKLGAVLTDEKVLKKDAVCKVVLEELFGRKRESVLLVEAGSRPAKEIVKAVAQFLVSTPAPVDTEYKEVWEVKLFRLLKGMFEMSSESREKALTEETEALLRVAAQVPELILYINDFHEFLVAVPKFNQILKEALSLGTVQCIVTTGADNYARHIEGDKEWEKVIRVITIHDIEVPHQL